MSMTFEECVKSDDNYIKYRRILRTVKEALDLVKTLKEASFLHSNRTVRKLQDERVSPQKLQDAIFVEIAARSRLTELKSLVINQVELLSSAISLCRKHLNSAYATELAKVATTISARNAVLDRVFASGKDYLNRVSLLDQQLDLYLKDIDAASYSVTNSREVMKMILDKRETV